MAIWETLKDAISAYTGLSPPTFFTVLAVALTFYYVVSRLFRSPTPPPSASRDFDDAEPLPPPVQLGEITAVELKNYDGSDPKNPLLMAIKGQIYDVSQSRMFYGPGGPYALFAGKDASRALAKMSFEVEDLTGDISGLGAFELDALQDWEYKFMSKYVKVGTIKPEPAEEVADGNAPETTQSAAREADTSSAPSGVENTTNSTNLAQSTNDANPVTTNLAQSTNDANPVTTNLVKSTNDANPVTTNPVQSTNDANPVTTNPAKSTNDSNPVQSEAVETTQVKEVEGNTN